MCVESGGATERVVKKERAREIRGKNECERPYFVGVLNKLVATSVATPVAHAYPAEFMFALSARHVIADFTVRIFLNQYNIIKLLKY